MGLGQLGALPRPATLLLSSQVSQVERPEASPARGAQVGLLHLSGVLSGFGHSPADISQSCLQEGGIMHLVRDEG